MSSLEKQENWKWGAFAVICILSLMFVFKSSLPGGLTQYGGFGEKFESRYISLVHEIGAFIKPDSGGYDGQFYAQIATDPSLKNPQFEDAIDEPAYRSRRIILPLIASILALGNPEASILIYCGLNVLFWFAFAWLIWDWLRVENARDFAKWLACVLSMGVLDSVKYSLTDLPSIFVILLMIRYATARPVGVGAGFVAAVFLKETNFLALPTLVKWPENRKSFVSEALKWGSVFIVSFVAFFLWYKYVQFRFGTFHGVSGNFDWPFFSMFRNAFVAIKEVATGNFDDRYTFRLLAIIGFLVQSIWFAIHAKEIKNPLIRLGLIYAFLFIFLGDLVWWGYWAVCRVVLPMTIAFNLLYNPKRYFWLGLILANLTVIHSIYRFI